MSENPYAASHVEHVREPSVMKTVKRFDVLQAGIVSGAISAAFSLVMVPFLLIIMAVSPRGAGLGLVMIIFLPIMYGVFGFIGGIIGAFVYNICAKFVGGIRVEVA